ncbi:hypothetical protein QWZ00_04700 [Belliella kenyensis]|uniref:hypothetical protein n=1 Tax=Belliella kenyensis TaxID=1472724 RepID=UPI0025B518C4|nr:hypothetical protein [Belliella kenyensis]MDN3602408.1 hypothetical protein [Belliella kenyensis]
MLVSLSNNALAQNNKTHVGRFEISVGAGVLIPVGKFASTSTTGFEQTVFEIQGDDQYDIRFFSKKNHAHAKRGGDLNIEINYLTKRNWVHGIGFGKSSNTVNLEKANIVFSESPFSQISSKIIHQQDFNINYLTYNLSYDLSIKKTSIRPYQKIGLSQLDFPYYHLEEETEWKISFIHEGDQPRSSGLYFESGVITNISLSNKFELGLNLSYRFADFDYTMYKRVVPGGSTTFIVPDQVNMRAIMTGFRLAYKL